MIINVNVQTEDQQYVIPISVYPCKCGKDPVIHTQWGQKYRDPTTEIPIAYYINCYFCDINTKIRSCRKAKTPRERLDILEQVVKEWNELVKTTAHE